MEQFDKNSEEALNELLRKYLLEESERDRLADEALEMHADFVFSEEPTLLPSSAREAEMISKLQQKVAAGVSYSKYWRIIWAAPVLALLLIGLFFVNKNQTHTNITQTLPKPVTTLPRYTNTPSASVAPIDTVTIQPIAVTKPVQHRHHTTHQEPAIEHTPDMPLITITNATNSFALRPTLVDSRPQTDLKALNRQVLRKMNQFITQLPSERIYAHTDRDIYQPGQDIWFSVYLRNEYDLQPSGISDIVKVLLTDPDGKTVGAVELLACDGVAQGDIHLAHGLTEGVYHFKAFTQWQQNNPTEFQYEKDIFINEPDITFNDDSIHSKVLKSGYTPVTAGAGTDAAAALRLEFYPEGGEMVAGHDGRVAFQVLDKNSDPIAVEGYVADQTGKHINTFKTTYRGMGMFALQPETGNTYAAYLTKPAGIKNSYALPKPTDNGLAIAIDKVEHDNTTFTIHASTATKSLLIVQVRGQIVYTHQYELKQGDNTVTLSTKQFPAGVAQFTLFNAYGEPTAERLAFVNRHKQLTIQLTTDKPQYLPREKVLMNMKVTDDKGQPVQGNFSLSVHDAQALATEMSGQGNIMSKLLLEADLGGHVDDGGAYFDTKDPQSASHLDLLLMTRGWRKFSWKQLLTEMPPTVKYPYEKGVLKGTVVDPLTGQPLKGIRVEVKGSSVKMLTNNDGKFEIHKLDLSEPKEITLIYKSGLMGYVVNKYDDNMIIPFYNDNRRVYPNAVNDAMHPIVTGTQKLPKDSAVILGQVTDIFGDGIPKATVTAHTADKKIIGVQTDAQGFYTIIISQPGEYVLEATATGYLHKTMKATLKQGNSLVTDVQLSPEKQMMSEVRVAEERTHIKVKDPNAKFQFLTDDVRLLAAGEKNAILDNANEQDKLDLAKMFNDIGTAPGDFTYYINGLKVRPNEAMPISTIRLLSMGKQAEGIAAKYESLGPLMNVENTSQEYNYNISEKSRPEDFKAKYYSAREFPTIKYKVRDRATKPTDFRTTVYWNGKIATDYQGKAVVEFFNSDDITTFAADMEGISEKGIPGSGTTTFNTQLPFKVFADVPLLTDQSKHIEVPVYFSNTSGLLLNGKLEYRFPETVHATGPLVKDYTIFPLAKDTLLLGLDAQQGKAAGNMEIIFVTNSYRYVLTKYMAIVKAKPEN